MAKIHRYVGLKGAKRIWQEVGKRFIDNTELNYVINNSTLELNGATNELTLKIPKQGGGEKILQVDLDNMYKDPLKIYLQQGQYDVNGVPTITNAKPDIIYLVPNADSELENDYIEWFFDSQKGWELIGGPSITDSDIYDIVSS